MIHLSKPRCGYRGYSCVGITQIEPFKAPNCDTTNYDIAVSPREQDNNFLNLPKKFAGVVRAVTFIDLSDVSIRDPYTCINEYDPLNGNAIDAFDIVADNQSYRTVKGNQKAALTCYSDSGIQGQGILLPGASLGAFSPVPMLAVPTVALASMVPSSVSARGSVKSGCQGFCTTAKSTGSYQVEIKTSAGKAIVGVLQDGTPKTIDVKASQWVVSGDKESLEKIQVYIVAGFDIQRKEWKASTYIKTPDAQQQGQPEKWIKRRQVATVVYVDRSTIDVIQGQCSPIDLRDWVSEQEIPEGDDQQLYVFSFKSSSTKKGWIPVKDC